MTAMMMLRNPKTHVALLRMFSSSQYRNSKTLIRNETDPDKIAQVFLKTSDNPRFYRDRSAFHISVRKLAKLQRFDLVEKILEQQIETPLLKTEGFWIRIMMLYSHAKMLDQVIATFDRIAELDCNQTDKSMCALLSACLQNRRFDLVHQYFESVPAKTAIKPGVVAYNLLMRAYIDEKKIDSARSLLDKMESEKGIKPDVASYNVVLTAYLRNGEEEKFDKLFDELLNKGLEPNLVTYNLRIKWFCKKKDCDRAKEILQEMLAKGVKPNVNSYNAVIDGFCKIADFESAKKVFDAMNAGDESVKPNSDSYITLIQQLVQEKEFIQALDMCKESLQKKWVPPFTSMEGLVKGLVEISKADEAKEIVETMKKRLRGSAPESWSKVEGLLPLQHITA